MIISFVVEICFHNIVTTLLMCGMRLKKKDLCMISELAIIIYWVLINIYNQAELALVL